MTHLGFAKQAGVGKAVMGVARKLSPEHRQIGKLRSLHGTMKGGIRTELSPRLQSGLRRAGVGADKRLKKKLVAAGAAAGAATVGAAAAS